MEKDNYGNTKYAIYSLFKSTMYLVKTIYGILSFPFLIYNIPGLTWVLTRSHGTGYDRLGNCIPIVQDLNLYH